MISRLLLMLLCIISLFSWLAVGWFTRYLEGQNLYDRPNQRSMHTRSTPRGAGLVIIAFTMIAGLLIGIIMNRLAMFLSITMLLFLWASLGWWDDNANLSARFRFAMQIMFSLLCIAAFGFVTEIHWTASHTLNLGGWGALLTGVGIVWFANLYNFMDGIDGLVASQTIIGGVTMAVWFWQLGETGFMLLLLVVVACSYGFLLHNWSPAKVFLGDVGSIGLGALLAIFFVLGNNRYGIPILSFILLFGVFIWDTMLTFLVRLIKKEPIWIAHKDHLYQHAARQGFQHSIIVIFSIILMMLCSLIASITVIKRDTIPLYSSILLVLFAFLTTWIYARSRKANTPD